MPVTAVRRLCCLKYPEQLFDAKKGGWGWGVMQQKLIYEENLQEVRIGVLL